MSSVSSESILTSVKKMLGIDEGYEVFDMEIIIHINSVFATLHQLGVGPSDGFSIFSKDETWGQFIADTKNINNVKTYVYLRVRLIFDPPAAAFALTSFEKQIAEHEWRLTVAAENNTLPAPPVEPEPEPDPDPIIWTLSNG